MVALHHDIAVVAWSLLIMIVWRELFYEWIYVNRNEKNDFDDIYDDVFLYAYELLQVCAERVGCSPVDQPGGPTVSTASTNRKSAGGNVPRLLFLKPCLL